MKKVISILLFIASILSFYIVYQAELNKYTKSIEEIEMKLPNNYQIMIPINIDNKDRKQSYETIIKVLDKYKGSIYYDRVAKDEITRTKYIYDNNNYYISNIKIMDGIKLNYDSMEPNQYLSTRRVTDKLQIGRIANFNKNVNREIRPLISMLDDNFNFSGPCYISFKASINIQNFINELQLGLGTDGITIINSSPMNIVQDNNYKFVVIIIYFIVMLLILYELLNSYKKIGVKKLLGYSAKQIYIENILYLIKINVSVGVIVTISMLFIFFNQLNIYVYSFILKILMYIVVQTVLLVGICSIAYIYILFINISDMLKNKKPLTAIIVLNYIAKCVCLISMMFFIVQTINNSDKIKRVFNKNYSNWEALDNFAIIPVSNIPIEIINDSDYYNNTYLQIQQQMYKEFNEKGAIFANFNEFSPSIRRIRLSEKNHYYETDNVVVNPNYLNQYKIYNSESKEVIISEADEDQIILVPDKYKDDEKNILKQAEFFKEQKFYAIGENQKTKIIWTKSNQKVFTASVDINPDEGNKIIDPIIYVLTEKNGSLSDYNYLLGIMGNPFKIKADNNKTPESTIREIFEKYSMEKYIGTITPVNEQVASSINTMKESIKNSSIVMSLLIVVLSVIIIQNCINYFDKYRKKLSIERLIGYRTIDKHKNYIIGIVVCWNTIFSISILIYKTYMLKIVIISIVGFMIEIVFSLIVLRIIEKKKIINIIKGE